MKTKSYRLNLSIARLLQQKAAKRWFKTNANWSPNSTINPNSGGKLPPFGQRVFPALLEPVAVD